ncbi:MAG: PAS domain S-box protein [Dehalogenimonas sp.]
MPVGLLIQDYSAVKQYLDKLVASGVSDIGSYLTSHSDELEHCINLVKIIDANDMAVRLFQTSDKRLIVKSLRQHFTDQAVPLFAQRLATLMRGEDYSTEIQGSLLNSETGYALIHVNILPEYQETWARVQVSLMDITARQKAEDKLLAEEEFYRDLFMNAPFGYHSLDSDGCIKAVNNAWLDDLGYTRDEVIGRWFGDFLLPDQAELFRQRFPKFKASGKTHTQFFMRRKNGVVVLETVDDKIAYDLAGNFERTHCILQNVTEERRAEEALRNSEESLRNAQRYAGLGSWKWDIKTNKLEWSDEMYHLFGVEKVDFNGELNTVIAQSIHPDDQAAVESSNQRVVIEGKPTPLKYRIVRPDGAVRWVWAEAGELQLDDSGQPAFLSGYVLDITDRQRVEDELVSSRTKYQSLFESSGDAAFLHRPTPDGLPGKFVEVNEAACLLLGYTRDEFLNLGPRDIVVWEVAGVTPPDIMKRLELDRKVVMESAWRHKDGHEIPVEVNIHLFSLNGQPSVLTIGRDITERKKAETELKKTQAQLQIMLGQVPCILWAMDTDLRYTSASGTGLKTSGRTSDDLVGKTIFEYSPRFTEDDPFVKALRATLAGQSTVIEQTSVLNNRTFLVYMEPMRSSADEIIGIVGISVDITERKQAEISLEHAHDLLRYVIEHTQAGVAIHDRDLNYIYVSQRYLDEYGIGEQDIIGKHHYDVFPDLPQKWRDVHQRVLAGEICSADEDEYVRADGTVEWTRWECRPWYQPDGSIGGLIVYTEVITDRKKAEEKLKRFSEELEGRNVFIQAIIDHLPIGLAVNNIGDGTPLT